MTKYLKSAETPKDWPAAARVSGWYVVVGRMYPVVVGEPHKARQDAERTERAFYASERAALNDCNRPMR